MFRPIARCFLLLTIGCAAAQAQEKGGQIVSDRPDLVETSEVVGKGRVQLETGVLVERERGDGGGSGGARTYSMPTLLRVGLGESLEMRIETEGRTIRHSRDTESGERSTVAGYADTALGLSWHVLDGDGMRPSLGVLVDAELPTGSRRLRGEGVRPSLRVVGEWALPGELELGLMPGVAVESDDDGGRYTYGIFGAVLEKAFSERLHGFAEIALPQIARSRHGGTQARFDVGAAWFVSSDCQIDTMFSRGLNDRTPYASFTVGLSIRR
ncbi:MULTISPECIES: transporter [unclassified Massilia]|uniref:transporter n=1 Tax=unclassified Massilia TaxID=2609279 RepID=UPI00177F9E82|nr:MULTISPECIES: transporter [unclassified Massilia]MBD8532170.1 transporter [Massilia sp. CFBP 13647]MBD8675572.1 transporter [Massilia sp. CFBP 13721]